MSGENSTDHVNQSWMEEDQPGISWAVPVPEIKWNDSGGASINSTTNLTNIDSFYFYEKEQLTTLWILLISIVLGNSSVLLALVFTKGRKSRVNYFIMHLAIADLSVGLVNVLTDIVWRMTIEWNAGNIACKVVRYSQVVVTYSSTFVLVALSIDRYDAIRHPMNFSGSWKRAKCLVIAAWFLSFFFSLPVAILYEEKEIQGHKQCWIDFLEPWHWQLYMILVSVTVFFIPACIIATCYAVIIYTIWSKSNILTYKKKNSSQNGTSTDDPDCKRVSSRGLIPKAKIKTVKMTLVIVFVFILCWSPYMVFDLLQVFDYIERTQTNIAVATFIQSLAPLNSAANPIIYCLFSTYLCRNLGNIPPLKSLPKWYDNTKIVRGGRVTDTSSMTDVSQISTKRYIHLHSLARLDNLSTVDRNILQTSGEL